MPHPAFLTDDALLTQCRMEAFRASGPGGQKRNKTSSAIRITHTPTGHHAIANESRSQSQNKAKALQRLRHTLVLEIRTPFDPALSLLPEFWPAAAPNNRLGPSPKTPLYLPTLHHVLNLLDFTRYSISETAAHLQTTTANLVSFLKSDEKAWTHLNHHRQKQGLRPLN